MGWNALPLITDDHLGAIEPAAVDTSEPWGASTWPDQRAQAMRELKVWIEADFGPGAADRIVDRWSPDQAFQYTGGTYTDRRTALADDHEEDLDLSAVFATYGSDRLYVGLDSEFDGLHVQLLDSLNQASASLTVKYWGPTGWASLNIADGTRNDTATFGKTGRVTWAVPSNWERRRLNGTADEYFWVELSVSAALTSGTAVTQMLPTRAPEGLRQVAALLAIGRVVKGFALQSADPIGWRDRGEGYLSEAVALYQRLRAGGAIPIDLNRDQAVQPTERRVVRPLRLQRG